MNYSTDSGVNFKDLNYPPTHVISVTSLNGLFLRRMSVFYIYKASFAVSVR